MRNAGDLRRRAHVIASARQRAEAERKEVERKRQAEIEERARRARLHALRQRGEAVWREIEAEIERRNASGYDRAAGLLRDLQILAGEQGTTTDFRLRLRLISERHARKERFIERLGGLA